MDYEIKVSDSKKYIKVKLNVNVTSSLAAKMRLETDKLGKELNIERILFDVRKSRNLLDVSSNYKFSKDSLPDPEKYQFKKIANLTSFHDNSHGSVVAFSQQRGFGVREFVSENEAKDWLDRD